MWADGRGAGSRAVGAQNAPLDGASGARAARAGAPTRHIGGQVSVMSPSHHSHSLSCTHGRSPPLMASACVPVPTFSTAAWHAARLLLLPRFAACLSSRLAARRRVLATASEGGRVRVLGVCSLICQANNVSIHSHLGISSSTFQCRALGVCLYSLHLCVSWSYFHPLEVRRMSCS